MEQKNFSQQARDYKRRIAGSFILVDGDKIAEKVSGNELIATRKYDGIMTYITYFGGCVEAYNSGGQQIPSSLHCLIELVEKIRTYGAQSIIVAAELFAVVNPDGRERVADALSALADERRHDTLKLAPFDIVEIDGEAYHPNHYRETLKKLQEIFSGSRYIKPLRGIEAHSVRELSLIFNRWVGEKGAEGIVVRSELPFVYKIKPRHTFDAAVIGYTTGEDSHANMVRDLLLGMILPDGTVQQIASVGSGLSEELRASLHAELEHDAVESDYITTDSRNVAFRMVRPRLVVEFSAIDCVTESSTGEAKMNMLLEYNDATGYESVMKTPGVAVHSPVFIRLRYDKQAVAEDVRISQLTDVCAFASPKADAERKLPESTLLSRRVFIKRSGLKTMVQKFVVWQTNKEHTGDYPAYVVHHTDYSYSRQEQLRRDIRVSSNRTQIMQLLDEMIMLNIKKGWEEIA